MRICAVNVNAEEVSQSFLPVLERDFALVKGRDTEVVVRCPKPGLERATDINHAYFTLLNKASIVDRVIEAAAEGFDAAMILCFNDPALREAREVVDIPVIGVAEASMFLACQMGGKFALVTLNEPKMWIEMEQNIKLYGLEGRVTRRPIVPVDIPSREWMTRGMREPEWVAAEIERKARQCVEDGADIVVVGCAALGPLMSVGGVTKIADLDVPIIDPVQAGLKMAELRVELGQLLKWSGASRAGLYGKPRDKDISRVRGSFCCP